jgi:hypothetical protein
MAIFMSIVRANAKLIRLHALEQIAAQYFALAHSSSPDALKGRGFSRAINLAFIGWL